MGLLLICLSRTFGETGMICWNASFSLFEDHILCNTSRSTLFWLPNNVLFFFTQTGLPVRGSYSLKKRKAHGSTRCVGWMILQLYWCFPRLDDFTAPLICLPVCLCMSDAELPETSCFMSEFVPFVSHSSLCVRSLGPMILRLCCHLPPSPVC